MVRESLRSGSPPRSATGWSTFVWQEGTGCGHGPASCSRPARAGPLPRWPRLGRGRVQRIPVKRRFSEDDWTGCSRTGPKPTGTASWIRAGAHLIALTCTPAPDGMTTGRCGPGQVELGLHVFVPRDVRRHLKKTPSSRGRGSSGADSRGERRLRGPHGGRAAWPKPMIRPRPVVCRRDLHPVAGRCPSSPSRQSRVRPQAGGLRVCKGRHPSTCS